MIKLTKKILAAGVILVVCSINASAEETFPAGLVARKDFNANREWQPPQVMRRDFWNILAIDGENYIGKTKVALDEYCFKKLKDKPVYKESGRGYVIAIFNKDANTVTTSEIFRSSWSIYPEHHKNLSKNFFKQVFESTNNPAAPFFVCPDELVRPSWGNMPGKHNYDFGGYEQWKKDYPNFMGFQAAEWDNECVNCGPWSASGIPRWMKNRLSKEILKNAILEFPNPATREQAVALIKKMCDIIKEFYFNDQEKLTYLQAMCNMSHYAYEWGAEIAWLETTNTAGFANNYTRWQNPLFFIRGASRQYNKKWGWYLASFYNGYPVAGGEIVGDSHVTYRWKETKQSNTYGWVGPDFGMSLSLYTRGMYLAYLSGASFVEHESTHKFVNKDDDFSSWGKALDEWFNFTQRNKRGISYAPVALLIPFEQCYPIYGGKSWFRYKYERPDWMIDAFMYTIAPHNPVTKEGNEGCLSNSQYGDIYDTVMPNTPGKPVSLDVLKKYKVAIMLGRYAKSKALAERLMEYVKDGGTLLINIKQLNEFFPEAFTGIERTNELQPVKGDAISLLDNAKISFPEEYECEKINLKGAAPVLVDSSRNVLASVNNYGQGRVIVTAVDYLVPKNNMSAQSDALGNFVFGREFPLPAYFLRQIVKEVMPLEVKGDIEYGLNKLDDGWLLYLINNKGITKFVDKIQSVDPSKTVKVEVFLKKLQSSGIAELREQKAIARDEKNNSFTIEIQSGDVKVVKIKN